MKKHNGWWWPSFDQKSHQARYNKMLKELEATLDLVKDKRICIQAGGAVGIWPQFLSKHFRKVYTFEPNPYQYECLKMNTTANNICSMPYALGETGGQVQVVTNEERCNASYVVNPEDQGYSATCIKIDDYFPHNQDIDFICLDLEGYELFALKGAKRILLQNNPIVQVEDKHSDRFGVSQGQVDEFMEFLGYELIHQNRYDKIFGRQK